MANNKIFPLEKNPLYRIRNKKKLAILLGTSLSKLQKLSKSNSYKVFTITKNSKQRVCQEPLNDLKKVHNKIRCLLTKIKTPTYLISGKKGLSYIDNARPHIESSYILTMDIDKFYFNCKKTIIFNFFRHKMKTTVDVAELLTNLVIYQNDDKSYLPTGSPSSQIIAYLSCKATFDKINTLSKNHNCIFTLYVDDLTLSSKSPIKKILNYLIKIELKKLSHSLNNKKTKYNLKSYDKLITGVVITKNNQLKIPNRQRLKIKKEESNKEKINLRLKGLRSSARQIDPNSYPKSRY